MTHLQHRFRKGEIIIFWHMDFYDHMLSGIGQTFDNQKVYVDCKANDGYNSVWCDSDNTDNLSKSIQEYMEKHHLTKVEDFPDELKLDDCSLFKRHPHASDDGVYELDIDYYSKFDVYHISDDEFQCLLDKHRVFQHFVGTHTDYPRGKCNEDYDFRLWNQFAEHPIVKKVLPSLKVPEKIIGYFYSNELTYNEIESKKLKFSTNWLKNVRN